MDSDNSESGKEEEDDDADGNKTRLDQMLANHTQYLQMCQTSARLLQVLTGYVGAPQEAHVIELESVSDDSDEVSSCSTGASSSETSNNEETTPPASDECVIWAEPLLSCHLVAPPQPGPCRDVRRLPPGVTPEDVKRSKAEAARKREAAQAELNNQTGKASISSISAGGNSQTPSSRGAALTGNASSSAEVTSLNQSKALQLASGVNASIQTTVSAATRDSSTITSAASSLANTQEGFKDAMSQICHASETIRQAHSLLTSMGLGHYSLARRIAQVNNNNTEASEGFTDTSTQARDQVDQVRTESVAKDITNTTVKADTLVQDSDGDKDGKETNNPQGNAETQTHFPPVIVVKPAKSNTGEEKNDGKSESNVSTAAKENSTTLTSVVEKDVKPIETNSPGIPKPRTRSLYRPIANTQSPVTRSDNFTDSSCRRDRNVSANVRQYSDTAFSWSSHLQRPTVRLANRVPHFPRTYGPVSYTSGCSSRTQQATSLAGTVGHNANMSPVDADSSRWGDARAQNIVPPCASSTPAPGSIPCPVPPGGAQAVSRGDHKHSGGATKQFVTNEEVKCAIEFAMRNVKKSGGWTDSTNDKGCEEPAGQSSADWNGSDKYEVLPDPTEKAYHEDFTSDCINAVIEINSEPIATKCSSNTNSSVGKDDGAISRPEGTVVKRVTFVSEPTLISTDSNQHLGDSANENLEDKEPCTDASDSAIAQELSDASSATTSPTPILTKTGDECPSNQSSLEMLSLTEEMEPGVKAVQTETTAHKEANPTITQIDSTGGHGDCCKSDILQKAPSFVNKLDDVCCDLTHGDQALGDCKDGAKDYSIHFSPQTGVFVCAYPMVRQHSGVRNEMTTSAFVESDREKGQEGADDTKNYGIPMSVVDEKCVSVQIAKGDDVNIQHENEDNIQTLGSDEVEKHGQLNQMQHIKNINATDSCGENSHFKTAENQRTVDLGKGDGDVNLIYDAYKGEWVARVFTGRSDGTLSGTPNETVQESYKQERINNEVDTLNGHLKLSNTQGGEASEGCALVEGHDKAAKEERTLKAVVNDTHCDPRANATPAVDHFLILMDSNNDKSVESKETLDDRGSGNLEHTVNKSPLLDTLQMEVHDSITGAVPVLQNEHTHALGYDCRDVDYTDTFFTEKHHSLKNIPEEVKPNLDSEPSCELGDSDTEPTLTASLPDESVVVKSHQPGRGVEHSLSTSDMTERHAVLKGSRSKRQSVSSLPLRSVSSQTDAPSLGRAIKPTKYFKSLVRRHRSPREDKVVTVRLLPDTKSPKGLAGFANTSAFFDEVDSQVPAVNNGDLWITRSTSTQRGKIGYNPSDANALSGSGSSSVSVIDLLSEKRPEELNLPEPSLSPSPTKDNAKKTCWEQDNPDPVGPEALCKVKAVGGSSSGDSDDETGELRKSSPLSRTFWGRTRRLRFRRRRRRHRHRQLGLWTRSVQWMRSKLKGPFCSCLKS